MAELPDGGRLLGGGAEDALMTGLQKVGAFCGGCGQEVYIRDSMAAALAREYLFLTPVVREGRPTVQAVREIACGRSDCGYEAELRERGAVARRLVPAWELLDSPEGAPTRRTQGAVGPPEEER